MATLWTRHSLEALIVESIWNGPITLHVETRHSVDGGIWYTLAFHGEDEQLYEVSGTTLPIVLRRAAESEARRRRKAKERDAQEVKA